MSEKEFHGEGVFDWQLSGCMSADAPRYHYDAENQWGGFSKDPAKRAVGMADWAVGPFIKYEGNPIFAPDPKGWDCGRLGGGVHNGAVVKRDGRMYYVYRAEFDSDNDPRLDGYFAKGTQYHCDIGVAVSDDGINFERIAGPLFRDDDNFLYSFEDVCLVDAGDKYYIYLNRWDWLHFTDPSCSGIMCAVSDDLIHWENLGLLFPEATRIHRNPCVLQDFDNRPIKDAQGRYVMYINDGLIAYSYDLVHWESAETKREWPGGEGCFALAGHNPKRPNDIVLFTGGHHSGHFYAVGEVLLSLDAPDDPIEWLENPVMTASPELPWEDGRLCCPPYPVVTSFADTIFFTGMTRWNGKIYAYYGGGEYYTCLARCNRTFDK